MLSFSLFHGFSFSSSPSSLFNAFRFLTILPSSRFPDHWRRFIDAVSTAQRAGRERERAQLEHSDCCYTGRRDTLIIKGKRTWL